MPSFPDGFSHPLFLGRGSFSSVYRARQDSLERWVVLKFLTPPEKKTRQNLLSEAKTLAGIRVQGVPEIFDVFLWKGQAVLVMEWIEGPALADLIGMEQAPGKPGLTRQQREELSEAVLESVARLHASGHTHGDLKPDNIVLNPKRGLYLLDFGFSQVTHLSSVKKEELRGTPAFMAPELWIQNAAVDFARVDVYALGKILEALLPGEARKTFIHRLVADDPDNRPENAGAALALWRREEKRGKPASGLGELSRHLWTGNFSSLLFERGKQALNKGDSENAYWMLAECIQVNANHEGALELISDFQRHDSRNNGTTDRQKMWTAAGVAVVMVVATGLLGFWVWNTPSEDRNGGDFSNREQREKTRELFLKKPVINKSNTSSVLRFSEARARRLSGIVKITLAPGGGAFSIGSQKHAAAELQEGVLLPYGRHEIRYYDPKGKALWDTKIDLLPFQCLTLQLPPAFRL